MPAPEDELERILADARAQLGRIRLEMPDLEDGTPSQREVQEWARSSLGGSAAAAAVATAVAAPSPPAPAEKTADSPVVVPVAETAPPPLLISVAAPTPPEPTLEPAALEAEETKVPVAVKPVAAAPRRLYWPTLGALKAPSRAAVVALVAVVLCALAASRLRTENRSMDVPFADFEALSYDASGGLIAARAARLERVGRDGVTTRLAELARPLRSLSWTDDGLYGADGTTFLLRWGKADAPAERFALDHTPEHVFASGANIWTQDAAGNVRQFLLNRSMTGVYLQPLDMAPLPGGPMGPFSVDGEGAVLAIDAQGALLRYEHAQSLYTQPRRLRGYAPGSRLVPTAGGARVLIPQADGMSVLSPL